MIFGFLNCNKPSGMTSRDVVNVVQKRVRPLKVGHAGTLDPLADGVLVLGVGAAVRLVPYVQGQQKHYRGKFRLGASSPSADTESEITAHAELPIPSAEDLERAATSMRGTIDQIPPAHSAIWVAGERAYKRARAGEKVEMPSRRVRIDRITVVDYQFPEMELEVLCGSGTYIRSIGMDLAQAAGSTAVMTQLTRIRVGEFSLDQSIGIEQLREAPLEPMLCDASRAVTHLPRIELDAEQSRRLGHGQALDAATGTAITEVEAVAITAEGQLRAIVRRKRGLWSPYRVFPLPG